MPRERGRPPRVRHSRRGDPRPQRGDGPLPPDPVHPGPPRAGRGIHGRRLRPADRPRRRVPGHARPGRHEPRDRHGRRLPRPRPDGRADRSDRALGDAQGEPPVHRRRADDEAGDEVERPRPRRRDHPRGRAQGVRRRRAREARRDAPRAARRRHGGPAGRPPRAPQASGHGGAGGRRTAPRRRAAAEGRAPRHPGGQRRRPPERIRRAAPLLPADRAQRDHHLHGQGRDRRRRRVRAVHRRPARPGLPEGLHGEVRPGDLRRLRPGRVVAGGLEPALRPADHLHRHRRRPRSTPTTCRRSS